MGYGAVICAVFCYVIFNKSIKGIVRINEFLIPVIIGLILLIGFKAVDLKEIQFIYKADTPFKSLLSSIIYASYNSIALVPILISVKGYIKSEKDIFKVASISYVFLSLLGATIFLILNSTRISNVEIPMIYVAAMIGNVFKYLYGIAIVIAILTSATAEGYSFIQNIAKSQKKYKIFNILICASSIFVSKIGFSKLVNILYPLFGYLGVLQIVLIAKVKKTKIKSYVAKDVNY